MNKSCARCNKIVYPIEELKCLDKTWHKTCFKCHECGMTLNMKTYKGYNKLPYCEAHIPKAKATAIADTPELKRIAENTKIQSNVQYHADFEKQKGKLTQVADDPETLRIKQNTKHISNVAYHGDLAKKAAMEKQREVAEVSDNRDNESEYFSETLAAESLSQYQQSNSPNSVSPLPPLSVNTPQHQGYTSSHMAPTPNQPAQISPQAKVAPQYNAAPKYSAPPQPQHHSQPSNQHHQHQSNNHQHQTNSGYHTQAYGGPAQQLQPQPVQPNQQPQNYNHIRHSVLQSSSNPSGAIQQSTVVPLNHHHVQQQQQQQQIQQQQQHQQQQQQQKYYDQYDNYARPNNVPAYNNNNNAQHTNATNNNAATAAASYNNHQHHAQKQQHPVVYQQQPPAQPQQQAHPSPNHVASYNTAGYTANHYNPGQVQSQQLHHMHYGNGDSSAAASLGAGIGKISDYDPLTDGPRTIPAATRNSATLIYNSSDRGMVSNQPRKIGSISDIDPANGIYGSIDPNNGAQQYKNHQHSQQQQHSQSQRQAQQQHHHHQQQHQQQQQQLHQQHYNPSQSGQPIQQQQQQQQPITSLSSTVRIFRALYDYEAEDTDEVSFAEGDVIFEVESIDAGWMTGRVERTGKTGMLPANYVQPAIV